MAIFQVDLDQVTQYDQNVSIPDFIGAKGGGGDGVNCSYKTWSQCHHQQPTPSFFTGCIPFLLPNQQCQSTEGKIVIIIISH